MEARDVITQLEQGYRMPEPANCPEGFYEVRGVGAWVTNPALTNTSNRL